MSPSSNPFIDVRAFKSVFIVTDERDIKKNPIATLKDFVVILTNFLGKKMERYRSTKNFIVTAKLFTLTANLVKEVEKYIKTTDATDIKEAGYSLSVNTLQNLEISLALMDFSNFGCFILDIWICK